MTDWGVPDGRDPAAYGNTTRWSVNRWRWEFTRRREDYRDDFDQFAKQTYEVQELAARSFGASVLSIDDPGFRTTMPGPFKYGLVGLPNPRIGGQPAWAIDFEPIGMPKWFSEMSDFGEEYYIIKFPNKG